MKDSELKEMLHYHYMESDLFIPNEIFNDLSILNEKGSGHIAFSYSYYYLINWLYRYTKYGQVAMDVKSIKKTLGYSQSNKTMDYIIKKGGVLDSLGYTSNTSEYPVIWKFSNNSLKITTISNLDNYSKENLKKRHTNRFTIKYPIKSFHRTNESELDHHEDGTYFDISNTHGIPFDVFIFCMSNKELGCSAFYLWSYLKMNHQFFKGGYDVSLDKLCAETYLSRMTLCRYLDLLKQYNMITTKHNQEYFSLTMKAEDRKSNTYIVNESSNFTYEKRTYVKIKNVEPKYSLDEIDKLLM